MTTELAYFNAAKTALAKATKIDEVKDIRDKAEALRAYKKQAGETLEMQNNCAEIKIRAEVRMGEILLEMPKAKGKRTDLVASCNQVDKPTLKQLGIEKTEAHRVQVMAKMPPKKLESIIAETKAAGEELTSKAVYRVARKEKEEQRRAKRAANSEKVSKAKSVDQLDGVFPCVVIDPPWDWGDEGDVDQLGRATPLYETWPVGKLATLPISKLADKDCHLYLWITNRSLPKGFQLLSAWGFRYVTMLTWPKPSFGMGNYFRGQTEHVMFGIRGSQMLSRKNASTLLPTWKRGPKGHSSKPPEFLEFVESCSPGPYLEMFSRSNRKGWRSWGEDGIK